MKPRIATRPLFLAIALFTLGLNTARSADTPTRPAYDPKKSWKPSDGDDDRWNRMDVGPVLASVLPTPSGTIAKGLTIRLGEKSQACVAYDTQRMTVRAFWTGGFVKFNARNFGVVTAPAIVGDVKFHNATDAWGTADVNYHGLYLHDRRAVLSYDVDGTEVRESPSLITAGGIRALARSIVLAPHKKPLTLTLLKGASDVKLTHRDKATVLRFAYHGKPALIALVPGGGLRATDGAVQVVFAASTRPMHVKVVIATGDKLVGLIRSVGLPEDIAALCKPGKRLWPKELITRGVRGKNNAPYVIDTIGVPLDNPQKALMFISGHDFFGNGDMAVSTLHGDVWLVRGVDDELKHVTWRRFATGLHQPLGLRIVKDKVYVLGRDQITRLHDRNGDGEADYYENFNNGGKTSTSGHDYAACLETDPDGNFYYIRAHTGVIRVEKDGSSQRSIATGFRNPVGLGVGPDGTITAAPQEGPWTPASCIIEVRPGGYYGFGGPRAGKDRPLGYDPPLCWMPRGQDNSSGGQVWVTSDRWGPLEGQMLHLSYGQCTMLLALRERRGNISQGGTVRFPLHFDSGVMRGRFSPVDGQLYLSGMRGWQTAAAKDGCLQRVRYTGKPVHMPVGLRVTPKGIAITFSSPLDRASAVDPDNYNVEQWNYRYSKEYGSKDYKPSDPKRVGHDEVYVERARLQKDGRTVLLELEKIAPVMQMEIMYTLKAADGTPIRQTIYNTIHTVGGEK